MELDNIKVVKKTKTVKKLVEKQEDEQELEEIKREIIQDEVDKLINALPKKPKKKIVEDHVSEQEEPIDNEEQPVKKAIKKVVKKAKIKNEEDINKDDYCWNEKTLTTALSKKKNNTFYNDYIKDKPFNTEWVEFVLTIVSKYTIEDYDILNKIFENAKEGQSINNVEIISKIIKDNLDYYENCGDNWIDKYMNKYKWLRININNGFKITSELLSNVRKYYTIYDELSLIHLEKTTSREPWQNQKFIEKIYKSEFIIMNMFINKHLTNDKNKQKFINLSEAYFKKNDNYLNNNRDHLALYVQFMLTATDYYNDFIMIIFLVHYDRIIDFITKNKKYITQNISPEIINKYMKKHNKLIDFNEINKITSEYKCKLEDYHIHYLINNINTYKFTEFKKLNISELLKYYKSFTNDDKIENLEYLHDGKFSDEDYYSLMLINNFTPQVLKKYGEKILKNNELSKKIYFNACNCGNKLIVEYFLLNKYNVTDEDILNTSRQNILDIYKQNNIFMTKDVLYKYFRKQYINFSLDELIQFTEYHNHPEDFEEIRKEIELNDFEEMICLSNNLQVLLLELEKKPIVTLDMILYLANDDNRNILYEYYKKQNKI